MIPVVFQEKKGADSLASSFSIHSVNLIMFAQMQAFVVDQKMVMSL